MIKINQLKIYQKIYKENKITKFFHFFVLAKMRCTIITNRKTKLILQNESKLIKNLRRIKSQSPENEIVYKLRKETPLNQFINNEIVMFKKGIKLINIKKLGNKKNQM